MNTIEQLNKEGQSLWYDNIDRKKILDGSLLSLIRTGKITGVTSNPTIFQKAITASKDYDLTMKPMAWAGEDRESIFWQLAIEDIRMATGFFLPVYKARNGKDGFVSLEVNPLMGYETEPMLAQAKDLWGRVNMPNVMIKIPATKDGLPAIRKAIAEGININITLIFAIERYVEVMDAYLSGLEDRIAAGKPIDTISSVASFFVSRMDTKVDGTLAAMLKDGKISQEQYDQLAGKSAIANARLANRKFEEFFGSERFKKLKEKGAQIQRILWASTSTKNPSYRDVMYVEHLIGENSVDTVPPATLDAFLDHGVVQKTIDKDLDEAEKVLSDLEALGISIAQVTSELEQEGIESFSASYRSLLDAIEKRRLEALSELGDFAEIVKGHIDQLDKDNVLQRLFDVDPSLWTTDPKGQDEIRVRLDWLNTPYTAQKDIEGLKNLLKTYKAKGYTQAVLLGMGGSSLAPEVINEIIGSALETGSGLELSVLDSTDPTEVADITQKVQSGKTLYIVASKSGTTAEINAFFDYFWHLESERDSEKVGERFLAITDPGTKLANLAESRKFSSIQLGDPRVGGRNSALTNFGLVPAALIGVNLDAFLHNATHVADLCQVGQPLRANPGMVLGAIMGAAALQRMNKVTFITDKKWTHFGDWLEQLIAESSGKDGKGMLPVVNEPELAASQYRKDRLFVYIENANEKAALVESLRRAGHPVISIHVDSPMDLAGQFYLWEVAVAVACSIIGVNSFDQPDVQDAKTRTVLGLEKYKESGKFEDQEVRAEVPGARIYSEISAFTLQAGSLWELIDGFIRQNREQAEFFAINAFLPMTMDNEAAFQELREKIGNEFQLATTLGFGPRYLHSTGQFHKGGPNSGLFLLVTAERQADLDIPGQGISFAIMQRAQAIGDLQALQAKERKVLWIDLNEPDAHLIITQ